MSNQEYISVAEYAKIKGISKQAVYKQLNNKLKRFSIKVDGKTCLKIEALTDIEKEQLNEIEQPIEQPIDNQIQPFLQEQIAEKDKTIQSLLRQIESLQEQNANLTNLLQNSQMILAAEKQLQLTEAASKEQEREAESQEQEKKKDKKGFFGFFRKRDKAE